MRRHSIRWLFLAVIAVSTSCGARTGILTGEPSASGGTSGASGAGAGGSAGKDSGGADVQPGTGGTAGLGGSAGAGGNGCQALTLKNATIDVKGDSWVNATQPTLVSAADDDSLIALALVGYPIESPGPVAARLQFTAFHPWGDIWPPYDLGTAKLASTTTGMDETVLGEGSSDGVLSMAWPTSSSPPSPQPTGVFFVPDISPYSGSWSTTAVNVESETSVSQVAAFVVRAPAEHVVGFFQTNDYGISLRTSRVSPNIVVQDPSLLACGAPPLSAKAVWNGKALLIAMSSSRTPLGCTPDNGPVDLAQHVQLVSRSLDGSSLQVLFDSAINGDAAQFVDVALHDQGEWLVYEYMGLNADVKPPVMLTRFSEAGSVQAGPVAVVDGPKVSGNVAVARMANRLAVAWLEPAAGDGTPQLQIRVFNEDGTVAAPYTIAGGEGWPTGRVSLIASRDGSKLLAAWSVAPMGGGMLDITRLARLDCGLP